MLAQKDAAALFLPVIKKRGQRYKKFGNVSARKAFAGEEIVTVTGDGVETRNVAKEGDMVVQNPGGEQYIISGEKFNSRYAQIGENHTTEWRPYAPTGECDAVEFQSAEYGFENPYHFVAPWGEIMVIKDGDMICTIDNVEVYRIARKEFEETYKPL